MAAYEGLNKGEGSIFSLAGLWKHWESLEGKSIESCTIIVIDVNMILAPIHVHMPVIIEPEDYETWLDADIQDSQVLVSLLAPYPHESMTAFSVSQKINNPSFNEPSCLEGLGESSKTN